VATYDKQLRRLPEQGQIAGVCAGLAEYFQFDVTLVRLTFIILTVMSGGGMIIGYIVMALILPTNATASTNGADISANAKVLGEELKNSRRANNMRNLLGAGVILLGLWLLIGELFPGWLILRWDYLWPMALIILGLLIITKQKG
jgi:phage shock protein C